ncbi:MAG: hypothetical protein R2741_12060 [Methanolobus sp.]
MQVQRIKEEPKTTQKISIYNISEKDIEDFYMKDVELKVIGRSNRSIGLGRPLR